MLRLLSAIVGALFIAAIAVGYNNIPKSLPQQTPANSTVFIKAGPASGSGVNIGNRTILTAAHVIGDFKSVVVKPEGGPVLVGTVLWTDTDYDIALLSIPNDMPSSFLSCRTAELREHIEIVGNPMGQEFVHLFGQVAKAQQNGNKGEDYFYFGAPIAPGNSGGPVFDKYGYVIGIVDKVIVSYAAIDQLGQPDLSLVGIGLAVPSIDICGVINRHKQ